MTEAEWLACTSSWRMLDFLDGKASQRKLRLFAGARCRQVWHLLADERSRAAIEVGERFADGEATTAELNAAAEAAWVATARPKMGREASARVAVSVVVEHDPTGNGVWDTVWDLGPDSAEQAALKTAADKGVLFLRDIFGNPFHPVSIDNDSLTWCDGAVVKLARAVYDERELPDGTLDAARLAVLADMLEEAGCTDADMLSHLRGPGPHVRGCWAVDLLLDKE
jgi:hypothetical protein